MKRFFLLIFILSSLVAVSQPFTDDFEDADISDWYQSTAGHWAASDIDPINGSYSLHHIFDASASGNDRISHPISGNLNNGNTIWKFQVKYTYNPSSTNNWSFFLMADANADEMLPGGNINGYLLGVNFTGYDDTLYLWKISSGSASVVVNTHLNWQDVVGSSTVGLMVQRTATGDWKVFIDYDGGFDNLVQIGETVNDQSFTTANYLGVYYEYTSSQDMKLWVDDVQFFPPSSNDNDSYVSAGAGTEPLTISSLVNSPDGVQVFDFTFTDQGTSDGLPTLIQSLTITAGNSNNISNWQNVIAGAKLFGPDLPDGVEGVISADNITFSADTLIKIQNNTSETYHLNIWLKTDLSSINDNDNFEFKIDYQDIITYYEGSSFGSGAVESGDNNLQVSIEATELRLFDVPVSVLPNQNFSLGIKATDANGNIDLDANNLVSLSLSYGDGNLTSASGLSQNLSNGQFLWTDLQYSALGTFRILAQSDIAQVETPNIVSSQYLFFLNDDFEDGNIVEWQESQTGHWAASDQEPINGIYSLRQVYDASDYGTDIICHQLPTIDWNLDTLIWRFQVKYENNSPSSTNNWQVFLVADNDYTQMNENGNLKAFVFGVNFGSSDDILKLWYIDNGNISDVITTSVDWNNVDANLPKSFEILRSSDGNWEIKIDYDGDFDNMFTIGTGNNNTTFTTSYFGIVYNYSSTQDRKLTLDDIYIGEPIPDLIPPVVDTVFAISPNQLKILFNEQVSETTAEDINNYNVIGIGNPSSATLDAVNKRFVVLDFSSDFQEDTTYNLSITGVTDVSGNQINDTTISFAWKNIHLDYVNLISQTEIDLKFTKKVDTTSAVVLANYSINNGIGSPVSAVIDEEDSTLVHLTFSNQMQYDQTYILHIENIQDRFGNVIEPVDYQFVFYVVRKYDIVINELMIDVNPQPVALPPYKYIELYNTTNYSFNLADWTLKIGDNRELVFPDTIIDPHGYVIICPEEAYNDFKPFGKVCPILVSSYLTSTSGKRIIIKNQKGDVIEDLTYSPDWYYDPDKDDGGWSLERIDPTNYCNQENNWHATENYAGGTPGFVNSVYASNPDVSAPRVVNFQALTSQDIDITFSESVDSTQAERILNYVLNSDHTPITAQIDDDNPKLVHLHFLIPHTPGTNNLLVKNISDYCGNIMNDTVLTFFYQVLRPVDVEPKSQTQLKVYFSEPVNKYTAENPLNYIVDHNIGSPTVAIRDANDSSIVHLFFDNDFPLDTTCQIQFNSITDIYGNESPTAYLNFTYHIPQPFDIIINELMLDVNPEPNGLPPYQYVELMNTTNIDLWLTDWTFKAENQPERTFPTVKIPAYGFVLLTTEDGKNSLSQYGTTVGILGTNDLTQLGKELQIFDNRGNLIYFLRYSKTWYQDEIKEDGGWSLEKIYPYNFCDNIHNWIASVDISGGTPGRSNSVYKENLDTVPINVVNFKVLASNQIMISFNKNLDFNSAIDTNNYYSEIGKPYLARISDTSYKTVVIYFRNQFQDQTQYNLSLSGISDNCSHTLSDTVLSFTYLRIHPEYVWFLSDNQLQIKFSETVDYTTGTDAQNYYIDNQIGYPSYVVRSADDPSIVFLQFDNHFENGQTYTLQIENVKDINGNVMHPASFQITYYKAMPNDIVINEILFNPYPNCVDYVELYNRCPYPINLKDLRIAKRDDNDSIVSVYRISDDNLMFNPGEYLVLTTDTANVKHTYPNHGEFFVQVDNMPSMPDDEGNILILNDKDSILDEFHYSEDFHFALISDPEGVALERVNPNLPTQDTANWHSAAQSVGFGTPGLKNSQYHDTTNVSGEINLEPSTFSPDNDGFDDVLYIYYNFDKPGYYADVLIFNKNGQLIKYLVKDELIEQKGYWTWDGLDGKGRKAKVGIYVVFVKIFDDQGNVKAFKKACVVAGMR